MSRFFLLFFCCANFLFASAQTGAPKKNGMYTEKSGKTVLVEGMCRNGLKTGTWSYYNTFGKLQRKEVYSEDGILLNSGGFTGGGPLWEEFNFRNGKYHGQYLQSFNAVLTGNEALLVRGWYTDGIKDSTWTFYRVPGTWKTESWKMGVLKEVRTFYENNSLFDLYVYDDGHVTSEIYYDRKGKEIVLPEGRPDTNTANDSVYDFSEVPPEFYGGPQALAYYLQKNIRYPATAMAMGLQGKVYVSFIVSRFGKVLDPQVVKKPANGDDLADEAIRVVEMMPPWFPGNINGRNVPVRMIQPISFSLQ
jgi:TonB family protein